MEKRKVFVHFLQNFYNLSHTIIALFAPYDNILSKKSRPSWGGLRLREP